jgi:hypothetical protein
MNYYVDINNSYVGTGHVGTEADPFSIEDYNAVVTDTDISYLRGKYECSNFQIRSNLLPWNPVQNGCWIIHVTNSVNLESYFDFVMSGGIFHINGQFALDNGSNPGNLRSMTIRNCYVKATYFGLNLGTVFTCEGCLLDILEFDLLGNGVDGVSAAIVKDCAIKTVNGYWAAIGDITFDNCASNLPIVNMDPTPVFTATNCQENWVPPVLPAWDADQIAFDTSVLYAGISTPPQPGNPPYSGYATDLYGNPRNGIGAGYMMPVSVPSQPLPINPNLPGHTYNGVVIAGYSDIDLIAPKIKTLFNDVVIPNKKF